MIFIRAWLLMLLLGVIYSLTGWHWHQHNGHEVILALGYWWCVLIMFLAELVL